MTNNELYFLTVAKELNITRAAKKLFISQQCLSNHIKRLEQQYDVQLFYRKPHLRLTPAGERMYQSLIKVQLLEQNLNAELADLKNNEYGEIRFGIHSSRYSLLAPLIFPAFHKEMPHVSINVINSLTREFEKMVLSNEMDLFIGVNPFLYPSIQIVPLMEEQMSVVISDRLLRKYYGDKTDRFITQFKEHADLKMMESIPFMGYSESGTNLATQLSDYLDSHGIRLFRPLSCANVTANLDMAKIDYIALVQPQLYGRLARQMSTESNPIHVFPIRDWPVNHICLGYNKELYIDKSIQLLITITQDVMKREFIE